MTRTFDEADYRRRLDAIQDDMSTGEEIGLLAKGLVTGTGLAPIEARRQIQTAKMEALRGARKAMVKRIRAEMDRARENAIIPLDVQEIVTGRADELVKVP
ncbi:hypothetical protein BRADO3635 [Bradyrhizobium sp. ORS 278]|uniref:hypothetical protein n=1 Tax=Bradyrhizobium sp. (strain ORS 278) TaxID=114615 RepID=UPI0001508F47|nr:hypothetical protein [Bradyrhizobium sp. ORS 278]CAL77412.1 hypothetical protein BRADO3635 [Bradyrhizobium sp. ORS 278]